MEGPYDKIKQDINRNPMFFTDFVFKNKNAVDIQRRCGTLLQYIERENIDINKDKSLKSKLKEDEELYGTLEPVKKKVKMNA
ncbi:unnamed protein product [Hanseniaspora opuntiae]